MIQLLTTIGMAASLMAPQNATAPKACSLFTKAEVKKITGTDDPVFNMVPPREEPLGAGSACFYSGIVLQVDPFSAAGLEANRQKNGANWETVGGFLKSIEYLVLAGLVAIALAWIWFRILKPRLAARAEA